MTNNNQQNCYLNEFVSAKYTAFKCDGTKKTITFIAKDNIKDLTETTLIKAASARYI